MSKPSDAPSMDDKKWIMLLHNQIQRRGVSHWIARVNGRRRRIELQKYKGRLYLIGSLWYGRDQILPFEATLHRVLQTVTWMRPRDPRK